MTDQIQPVDVSLNNMLTMFRNQMSNISSMVETHAGLVEESMRAEADDYNEMIERLESADSESRTLKLKVAELEKELEEKDVTHIEQMSLLRSEFTKLKLKLDTWNQMQDELKRLRALNPDRLKKSLTKTKKLSEERLEGMQKAKADNNTYRKEKSQHLKRIADLEDAALAATKQVEHLQKQISRQDGDVLNTTFKGKDGLECFVYMYHWGLSFKPCGNEINVISDLDFHIVVRTNRGINLSVSCSDWFVPFLPTCKDLEDLIPHSLYPKLTDVFNEYAADTHQHLIQRVDWAKDTELATLSVLTEKQLSLLQASDFYSVYSVMHCTDGVLAKRVKGISVTTAGQIRRMIKEKIVKPWCLDNWTKEQVREYL